MSATKIDKHLRLLRKANKENLDRILADIKDNIPIKYACESHGITSSYFHKIIRQGLVDFDNDKTDTLHASLVLSMRDIEKSMIRDSLERIIRHEDGHKGAQWFLERRFWREYSPNVGVLQLAQEIDRLKKENNEDGKEMDTESD